MAVRIVNRSGKFMSRLKGNEREALEAVGKFCKKKMDIHVAVDTGLLKSNNDWTIAQNELMLVNNTPYAVHQEYGTKKMAAHPFMKPAALNYTGEIKRITAQHIGKDMKGKG